MEVMPDFCFPTSFDAQIFGQGFSTDYPTGPFLILISGAVPDDDDVRAKLALSKHQSPCKVGSNGTSARRSRSRRLGTSRLPPAKPVAQSGLPVGLRREATAGLSPKAVEFPSGYREGGYDERGSEAGGARGALQPG